MEKGYIQIYTGNGKGKTTSTIGLMLRAVGANKKIFFGQFMKEGDYSEIKILKERFPEITIEQFGKKGFISKTGASEADKELAREGLNKALEEMLSEKYDMFVLDEINVALFMELLELKDVLEFMDKKPEKVELVMSGRYAHKEVMEKADLVSEINMLKHYFNEGVQARIGIEM